LFKWENDLGEKRRDRKVKKRVGKKKGSSTLRRGGVGTVNKEGGRDK